MSNSHLEPDHHTTQEERIAALEAENAALRSQLTALRSPDSSYENLESAYAALQAEVLEYRQREAFIYEQEQAAQKRVIELSEANKVLQASLRKLAEEPELEKFLGHLLTVCTKRFAAAEAGLWRYEEDVFRLFVSYEDETIKLRSEASHPGSSLEVAKKIRNQNILAHLRKREIVVDYEEDFETQPAYEQYRDYFRQRQIKAALKIPMFLDDQLRGILVLRFADRHRFTPEEAELAHALANQAVLALELTRLAEEAQRAAIAQERNRWAGEIHDTLAQAFTAISIQLGVAKRIAQHSPDEVTQILDRVMELANMALSKARQSVWALHPTAEEFADLATKLSQYVEQMTQGTDIQFQMQIVGDPHPLSPLIGKNLLRIGQEAITNVLKHAFATELQVKLTYETQWVNLCVQDNGRGFLFPADTGGFGLISMSERADRINGNLTIQSQLGQGTNICIQVPVESL
ncbi:MAG: GAF domain-containing sensor histidine kinase [Leptolyngbyaceae cyanobacterium SL_5_9]|nr:GAF domain-containing sensor histidine kinase [Leptolyngbyaceae cyanobacterium SL_5_9]NJO75892.1 GAF domain-containing sensor histidine kinase [Leptolyngbyaceae cyanobacterium RM1_406_9]